MLGFFMSKLNIYDFVDKKKLDAVKKPIAQSHGLPNECYISKEYMGLERKKLFENMWTVIGVASSIPNTGDAKPFNLQNIPLIALRNKDNQIKVFHNVCSHRGHKLLKKSCDEKKVLKCPYHFWVYNLNGDLISTPHIGGMNKHEHKNFDKSSSGLKEVRSHIWLDMIFVNISNNAESFNEYIKPLNKRWSKFWSDKDKKLIRRPKDYGYFVLKTKTNWKFPIENYCESYHLPFIHPDLSSYSKIKDHYPIESKSNKFAGQGTVVYEPKFKGEKKFPCFPSWPKNMRKNAEYVSLFPNVMLGIHKDHYFSFWLEPIKNNYTLQHLEVYYVGDKAAYSDEYKSLRKQNYKLWHKVLSEDIKAVEGMQEGRNSPAYNGGNFSPVMDNPTHHFHQWVAKNLV